MCGVFLEFVLASIDVYASFYANYHIALIIVFYGEY